MQRKFRDLLSSSLKVLFVDTRVFSCLFKTKIDFFYWQQQDAENLRKTLENTDGQNMQLKLTEELEKTKNALKQAETRMETLKYQPPSALISLLNRTHDNEKELLEYKFKLIDKEKESCMNALNQVSKKQSGILGALKIAHSTTLEELNHKLELLK